MGDLHVLDVIVLAIYLLGICALGLWSKKDVHTREDFLLGGRRFGKVFMLFHAFGTGTHTDQAAAVVSESYKHGMSGIWAQWNWMMCTPFYWLLAPLFRRTRRLTIAEVYEDRYDQSVGVLCVVISAIGAMMAMGTMIFGTSRVFQGLLGIPTDADVLNLPFGLTLPEASFHLSVFVITILFVLYGAAGGIVAAVRTDFVQGLFIIVLSAIALPFAFQRVGGMAGVRESVSPEFLGLVGEEFKWWVIAALSVVSLCSIVSQSHIMSVTSSGKTEWEGRVGMCYGNFLKRFCTVGWCLLGVLWFVHRPDLPDPDQAFGNAVSALLGPGFRGLMLASIMAAAMSSCDSMMVTTAGLFTESVYRPYVRKQADEAHYLMVERVIAALVVVGALLWAYSVSSIFHGLKWFWMVTGSIGVCFWLGVLWRRANVAGAWASFIAVAAALALTPEVFKWLGNPDYPHIKYVQIALLLPVGALFGVIASLLTAPPDQERTDMFFKKIYTHIGDEEMLDKPFDEAIPPERRLVDAGGVLIVKPTRETWGGFLVAWGVVVLLIAGAWLLVRM